MISINVEKSEVKAKEPEKSLSQKGLLRRAKADAGKKMSLEKIQRLRNAGLMK